jgi:hypothetical protein
MNSYSAVMIWQGAENRGSQFHLALDQRGPFLLSLAMDSIHQMGKGDTGVFTSRGET